MTAFLSAQAKVTVTHRKYSKHKTT